MSKYQEALDNIKFIIKITGANKYQKDITILQELILKNQEMESNARDKAAKILQDVELYGDFYYKIEDWLTNCLKGNYIELPYGVESEYLKCALRIQFKEFAQESHAELEDEDIEYMVETVFDHFSENALNMEFLVDVFKKCLIERNQEKCNQTLF